MTSRTTSEARSSGESPAGWPSIRSRTSTLRQAAPGEPRGSPTLAKEMLITVTNFFRDPEAFEALGEQVIRSLVEQRPPDVPDPRLGARLRHRRRGLQHRHPAPRDDGQGPETPSHVQIFATDLDEDSIETARRGQYPKSIAADVSPARLKRYFTEENNHYKIKTGIREMVVFAKHNLIKDAALLQAGPDLLPERPDLHGRDPAEEADPDVSLHAQPQRLPVPGRERIHRHVRGPVLARGRQAQDLQAKARGNRL